jgi:D-proline reductase (dithiol) PrdB
MKPPRSLWVSFPLGLPLGVPNDPAFQKRVLLALLKLFEMPRPEGPEPSILVDYPADAPETEDVAVISCPLYYGDEVQTENGDPLEAEFLREIKALRPWYDMSVEKRKRTTVGVSRLDPDSIGEFLYAFTKGTYPENPRPDIDLSTSLKAAVEDIRAYYFESAMAQPGQEHSSNTALLRWFWTETTAGKVLLEVMKATYEKSHKEDDPGMQQISERYIISHHTIDDYFSDRKDIPRPRMQSVNKNG